MAKGILTLVAVRLKSSRLPRKALLDLSGAAVIARLHERMSSAMTPEAIVWCTSTHPQDDPLEALWRSIGAKVYRGDELDVMSRFIEVGWAHNAHTVIRVTGDNPLTDPPMLDHMVETHLAAEADYSYTEDLPRGTRCEVIKLAALETCHALCEDPRASEYMTAQIRRPDRFKVRRVDSPWPALRRPELRLTLDTPEDYAVLSAIYAAFGGRPPALAEVIAWLDANPAVRDSNHIVEPRGVPTDVNVRLKGDR